MLKNLTIEGGLQEDHLDFLWNLTEKVKTLDGFQLLARSYLETI